MSANESKVLIPCSLCVRVAWTLRMCNEWSKIKWKNVKCFYSQEKIELLSIMNQWLSLKPWFFIVEKDNLVHTYTVSLEVLKVNFLTTQKTIKPTF